MALMAVKYSDNTNIFSADKCPTPQAGPFKWDRLVHCVGRHLESDSLE